MSDGIHTPKEAVAACLSSPDMLLCIVHTYKKLYTYDCHASMAFRIGLLAMPSHSHVIDGNPAKHLHPHDRLIEVIRYFFESSFIEPYPDSVLRTDEEAI